jgi:hypothetical protein
VFHVEVNALQSTVSEGGSLVGQGRQLFSRVVLMYQTSYYGPK